MKRIALSVLFSVLAISISGQAMENKHSIGTHNTEEKTGSFKNKYVPGEITVMFKKGVKETEKSNFVLQTACKIAYISPYMGFHKILIPEDKTVEEMVEIYNVSPLVDFAEPNAIHRAFWAPNDPYYDYQWHFDAQHINMPSAWDIEQGGNPSVIVAVLDEGVAYEDYLIPTHEEDEVYSDDGYYHQAPDLAGTNFTQGYDFINNDTHPNDEGGHGTHVTGTIAQTTNNNEGVAGMAFNCTIMPVRVLGPEGGTSQQIADGVSYAWQNGADAINMSLGGEPGDSIGMSVTHRAIINATDSGTVVVCAAGNEGVGLLSYPAGFPECIAVAATDWNNSLAPYSQYGPGLDISAPGGDVNVDLNGDSYGDGVLQMTFADAGEDTIHNVGAFDLLFFHGTSMACPHVAGLCALLVSHDITGVDNIKNAIYQTATDLGDPGYDEVYGWGMINPTAALGWTAGGETELVYDDGEPTSCYFWPRAGCGSAVRFTPTEENVALRKAKYYITNLQGDGSGDGSFYVHIYTDNNGQPGDALLTPFMVTPSSTGWFEVDISSYGISVSEDFYIGIFYDGINTPCFGYDEVDNERAWDYDNGWSIWSETYFIRAIISPTGVEEETELMPAYYSPVAILQNYPNPFSNSTSIDFYITTSGKVVLSVYDITGSHVKTFFDEHLNSGSHTVDLDARDMSPGVYFCKASMGNFTTTRKIILMK